jgi:hypothetical protein
MGPYAGLLDDPAGRELPLMRDAVLPQCLRRAGVVSPKFRRTTCPRGAVMLEALVAALIFALAAIAIVGFQARAARHLNDAHFRVEARHLVHSALAQMQAADNATLYAEFDMRAGGAGYRALLAQAQRLPGVTAVRYAPEVLVTPGPSATSRMAAVTVQWLLPGEAAPHRYSASTAVGGR